MINILIDCDPGHDDIMAIFCALANKSKVNILGYTTVCGNNYLDNVTNNLCNVLSYINVNGDIVKGYSKPIVYEPDVQIIAHGESGLDGPIFNLSKRISPLENINSTEYIRELILKHGNITILAMAPLTNIAIFIKEYPELCKFIDEIIVMGGSIYGGNILKYSEFNIYADPHAADLVFNSGINITIAPIEVCEYCCIQHKNIELLKNIDKLSYDILEFYSKYSKERGKDKSPVFDLACTMYLLHPELFTFKKSNIKVVLEGKDTRGQTIFDFDENGNIKVLLTGDNIEIEKIFINDLKRLSKSY